MINEGHCPRQQCIAYDRFDLLLLLYVVQLVQECDYECCVVRAHMVIVVEEPILCNDCTECYITPTLPRDIDYSPVVNDISSPPSCCRQVEPSLIYVNELMLDLLSIHL